MSLPSFLWAGELMQAFLLICGSFLLGSLPFSVWVARWVSGTDLRRVGSRNPGATNVLRVAGAGPAALALIFDVAKGALPVVAAARLESGEMTMAFAAVAAIAGHVVSPFLGLRGGKGVATAAGALLVLSPLATAAGLVAFMAVVTWTRYVSLGSIVAALIIACWGTLSIAAGKDGRTAVLATMIIALVVLLRHVPNVKRLFTGEEPRLGQKVKQA